MSQLSDERYVADVLVLGGGPAGAWAAWSAASEGAKVILADKGYLGTSGATAPGGTNLLSLPPDPAIRGEAIEERYKVGGFLSKPEWIHRVLDQVWINLKLVEKWGYPFPKDENGETFRTHLHGPEYMKIMRTVVAKAGVKILDQSPAQELLKDEHGIVGARGTNRLDNKTWEVRANAVIIATGGCAFLSKGLGCNVLTGDGLLMATEAGAQVSGMEFSRHYAPSPAFGTVTRGRMLGWATYYDEHGNVLGDRTNRGDDFLAKMLAKGPVYAIMDKADTPEKQNILRKSHPIFFLPYDRAGIDVFKDKFPLTMRYEGTVRGTGGIRIVGDDCSTTIEGLYAAGDAATRENTAGARSGGGAYNASWAICSGTWSGRAAAKFALSQTVSAEHRNPIELGQYGLLHKDDGKELIETQRLITSIQNEVLPLKINYFRSEKGLTDSLARLNELWKVVNSQRVEDSVHGQVKAREAASMLATARFMYTAALTRRESRGMHKLEEYPDLDPNQTHRILLSGLEDIKIEFEKQEKIEHIPTYRVNVS